MKIVIVLHLAHKILNPGVGPETFAQRPHARNARGVAVHAHLSCWAFWSGASIIHVQGTIS
jgi:hypothetical protein